MFDQNKNMTKKFLDLIANRKWLLTCKINKNALSLNKIDKKVNFINLKFSETICFLEIHRQIRRINDGH